MAVMEQGPHQNMTHRGKHLFNFVRFVLQLLWRFKAILFNLTSGALFVLTLSRLNQF